jgi:glutathione S-transferase
MTAAEAEANQLTYVSVEEAIAMPGLRLALSQGRPSPWGFGARAILELKKIPFTAVTQISGQPNEELKRWTGQVSAPVAMFEDERPRTSWSELILLAERLAPEPSVVPLDADERAQMFGLCHELLGEEGLGWTLRLIIVASREAAGANMDAMLRKYGPPKKVEDPWVRANAIVAMFAKRLEAQRTLGRWTLVGDRLSAVDFYWTGFSNLIRPMPESAMISHPQFQEMAAFYAQHMDPIPDILIEHRDRVMRDYVRTPMRF